MAVAAVVTVVAMAAVTVVARCIQTQPPEEDVSLGTQARERVAACVLGHGKLVKAYIKLIS